MSDKIYITSIIVFLIWCINYFIWTPPVFIHGLLVVAFLGILASVFMDEDRTLSKDQFNRN